MNVFLYVYKKWWKFLFLTPLTFTATVHGICLGIFLNSLSSSEGTALLIVPIVVVLLALVKKYWNRSDRRDIFCKIQTYWCLAYGYQLLIQAGIEHDDKTLVAMICVFAFTHLMCPCMYALFLRHHIANYSYVERHDRANVSNDYATIDSEGGVDEDCTICLEKMEETVVKLNNCSHMYHEGCILDWLVRKRECPLCRQNSETRLDAEVQNLV